MRLKLNCDVGEHDEADVIGRDALLMPHIDMASIACGMHAGNTSIMRHTVALARQHAVSIGAHPGYPDRAGFGRRAFALTGVALRDCLREQIGALDAICREQASRLDYVKPHGALYNLMMRDDSTLETIIDAVAGFDPALYLVVQAGSTAHNDRLRARAGALRLSFEAFADRAYADDGLLAARQSPGAVHDTAERILEQVAELRQGRVTSLNGHSLSIEADTLCLHGDNPASVAAAARIRSAA